MKRKDYEIIIDIVNVIQSHNDGISKTSLMAKCRIESAKIERILSVLVDSNIIDRIDRRYCISKQNNEINHD